MKKDLRLIIEILIFQFVIELSGSVYAIIMPQKLKSLGAGINVYGNLTSLYAILLLLSAPFAGKLSDRFGRKIFLILALITFSFINFGYFALENVYLFALLRGLHALIVANGLTISSAYLMDGVQNENKTFAITLAGASIGLGYVIGPTIVSILIDWLGYVYPFLIVSIALLVVFLYFLFFVKEQKVVKLNESQKGNGFMFYLKNIKIRYILVLSFLSTGAYEMYKTPFNYFLSEKYNYDLKGISLILLVSGVFLMIYQFVFANRIFKRFGERKVILVVALIAAVSMVLFTTSKNMYTIIFFQSSIMIALDASIRSASIALIGIIAPNEKAYILGLWVSAFCLGTTVAPLISSNLYTINERYPYYVAAVLLVIAVMFWFRWDKAFRQHTREFKEKYGITNIQKNH